jgi:hypothetical protein
MVARAIGVDVGAMVGAMVAGALAARVGDAIKVGVAHAVKPIAIASKVS